MQQSQDAQVPLTQVLRFPWDLVRSLCKPFSFSTKETQLPHLISQLVVYLKTIMVSNHQRTTKHSCQLLVLFWFVVSGGAWIQSPTGMLWPYEQNITFNDSFMLDTYWLRGRTWQENIWFKVMRDRPSAERSMHYHWEQNIFSFAWFSMLRVRFRVTVMVRVTVCIPFSNFAHIIVTCKQVKPLYKDFCLVSINLERARWIGFMIKPLITLFIRLVAPVAEAYQKGFLIITRICFAHWVRHASSSKETTPPLPNQKGTHPNTNNFQCSAKFLQVVPC